MFYHHHTTSRGRLRFDALPTGHSGLKVVRRESHRDWEIVVEHRSTGSTIRRDQYSARIGELSGRREEYLRGFATPLTALTTARRRIDFICDIRDPRARQRARLR